MPIHWPWAKRPGGDTAPEAKQASWAGSGWGFVALHAQGEAAWTRRDYSALAREGFMRNPVVHRSVRLIAEAAAAVPWLLYEGAAETEAHPALDLLARPNQRQAGGSFFEMLYGHLLLSGNAYVELVTAGGAVTPPRSALRSDPPHRGEGRRELAVAGELHLLRPDRVTVVTDAEGWPAALEHQEGGAKRRIALRPLGRLGAQDEGVAVRNFALHLTLFHPLDDHYGFPPLEAALMALDIHNAAGRWNKALLDNSARPSGALVYAPKEGGNLTEEQFDRLKTELDQGYSGVSRAGRPLLLEGGLDWKAMALTPKDMDFVEGKHAAARDIALAFGVPPMLLGIPGDNTYANYQEANRAFYRLTVLPLVSRVAKELSAWLGPVFGEGLRFGYDLDQVEGLSAEREALWRRVGAAEFLSDDEKREAVGYGRRAVGQ
jgi:HK97 family phage portal protein